MQGVVPLTLDAKGRFVIPVNFRDELVAASESKPLVLSWNPNGSLTLYPDQDWQPLYEKLSRIDDFDPWRGPVKNVMLASKQEIAPKDVGDRILIASGLREMAGLEKEIFVAGFGRVLQIWNKEQWKRQCMLATQAFQKKPETVNFWEGL
ncbi:MAG: cell division/cell wall cluster transcriptional repressor MraZ [Zoogloeaceae bacterium]|jgi:MraZ protein|nr:cell division/cell wall cluster transcriptional repressor MraZ [Zoogloeaceae bacterium]